MQAVIVTAVLSAADRDPVVGAGPSRAAPNPRMQYRPGLLNGFLAKTGLDLSNPHH